MQSKHKRASAFGFDANSLVWARSHSHSQSTRLYSGYLLWHTKWTSLSFNTSILSHCTGSTRTHAHRISIFLRKYAIWSGITVETRHSFCLHRSKNESEPPGVTREYKFAQWIFFRIVPSFMHLFCMCHFSCERDNPRPSSLAVSPLLLWLVDIHVVFFVYIDICAIRYDGIYAWCWALKAMRARVASSVESEWVELMI